MKYTVNNIADKIFYLEFDNRYDMCMLFCRVQEFYESPNPNFRGQPFDMFDFMEWYSDKYGNGVFTYPSDWSGFNISSQVIESLYSSGFLDKNKYDYEMLVLHKELSRKVDGQTYYLIGTEKGDKTTLAHEVAHALYFLNDEYSHKMLLLNSEMPMKLHTKMCEYLLSIGYTNEVLYDEIQAYMATGSPPKFNFSKKDYKPFYKVYKEYTKDIPALKGFKRPKND
jgi:uncharacterized protein YqgQ